jgi:hypothetical protein
MAKTEKTPLKMVQPNCYNNIKISMLKETSIHSFEEFLLKM